MFYLKPRPRKLVYAITFETLAILLSTVLLAILSQSQSHNSLPVAIAVSVIALIWNYIFNSFFELIESKLRIKKRTVMVRLTHAISFELGLFFFTIPLYMWWYNVGFIKAISMEVTILVFFFIYTYLFTLVFDKLCPRVYSTENKVV
ncbi:PACE efflux transporter [Proteus cibarius]|uniref:PACE efflux transporter n=1 Tax=Proteus terrae subsp. cibarius TaxID=626774 RepID=A0A6I6FNN0_9GAMM|nr:PACE efflux transporter [Proteus terrae]MCM2365907.1 PACE efflux transporter [Proteus sp. FZP2095]QHP76275.1 PACE efflux transporter [Proteus vulgaris]MBG2912927.1 PACE efflux transporter [Proteus terrae subsp. cibarius]MBG3091372.1 PACE efflux transporter [Proteus terrae subsp. cibarius]MBG6038183.1 PACE efflux transporter [Proteus terrae subsp. cibarius]